MTSFSNDLSEAEIERIAILAEECGEVVQICMKVLRHGFSSHHPQQSARSNRFELTKELGHVLHAIEMLKQHKDVSSIFLDRSCKDKEETIKPYLHHQ